MKYLTTAIPAQAGIQTFLKQPSSLASMDSRLRGNDGFFGKNDGVISTTLIALGLWACLALQSAPALALQTNQVFVTSEKDNALTIYQADKDTSKTVQVSTHAVCKRPRHLQLTQDRKQLLIACSDDHVIAVWDIASKKVVSRIKVGDDPEMFDISLDGRMLYASNEEDATLSAYDLVAKKKLFEVKVGGEPEGVKVSSNGKLVFVTSEVNSLVQVVDVASKKVIKNIAVGKRPRRLMLTSTVNAGELWVSNELGASVSVIRLSDYAVTAQIDFKPQGMRSEEVTPVGMVLSPDGKTAYVGLGRANHVAVVDVSTRAVKGYVLVGKRAWGLGLAKDGSRLYVTNGLSDDMSIVDTTTLKATKTLPAGRVPHSVVIDD
jgi:PQQ-dependent catabolism-associated beta-propeller protein